MTIIFKHLLWKSQISGERLQDQWSSGKLIWTISSPGEHTVWAWSGTIRRLLVGVHSRSFAYQNFKLAFFLKPFGQILQNYVCKFKVQGNENLLIWWWPHDRDGRYSPEPVDRLHLTFAYSSWDSSQSWIVLVLNHIGVLFKEHRQLE